MDVSGGSDTHHVEILGVHSAKAHDQVIVLWCDVLTRCKRIKAREMGRDGKGVEGGACRAIDTGESVHIWRCAKETTEKCVCVWGGGGM
jgi:hypothetical protein